LQFFIGDELMMVATLAYTVEERCKFLLSATSTNT